MPKMVSEISNGSQFSRSSQEGVVADSQTRVFKVILETAGEVIDVQDECEISIGDQHPYNENIYCQSFTAAYDGDSRMVLVCTFQYGTTAGSDAGGQDPKATAPDVRPANWSVSSVIYEVPAQTWKGITGPDAGKEEVPANPVGDIYDGVTKMEPIVTFSVEQLEPTDPSKHILHVGKVNSNEVSIGTFKAPPRTLMFKGVQCQPVVEAWGKAIFRGWRAIYEFCYKANHVKGMGSIGWDVAIPQTGFNVKPFNPPGTASQDPYGQILNHTGGKIKVDPLSVPAFVLTRGKCRAMVLVHSYEDNSATQTPSAQPIPLNDDGTPRKETASPKVLIYRYQVQEEMDFSTLGLKLG
jgi:hypothetical protein